MGHVLRGAVAPIALAALALAAGCATVDSHRKEKGVCPPALDWQKPSSSTVTLRSAQNSSADVVLTQYTNGLYAKTGKKEMYQLPNRMVLFRGLEEKDWTFPGPFFMLEMPAFLPMAYVAQQFREPCSIPDRITPFDFVMPRGNPLGVGETHVAGAVRREGTLVIYDVRARETRENPAVLDASGVLDLGERTPIPAGADITGWDIAERRGEAGWTRLSRPPGVTTMADVYALKPQGK
jgi:hypothetical protein